MKIQRYEYDENEQDYIKQDDGKVYLRSDILPLLNPWKDADKEKPVGNKGNLILKIKYCGNLKFSCGFYFEGKFHVIDKEYSPCKVISWMHIPKNEGEE
jgi:hypothetical protein